MRFLLWLAVPLFALDQFTKWLVVKNFDFATARPVIAGFFDLVYVTNTGAAFGSLKNANLFFLVLSLVTLCVLLVLSWRGRFRIISTQIAVALLISGILGNVTDRITRGHVIDFLDFHIGDHHWPAFNVADSCICVAVAILLIQSFREEKMVAKSQGS